VWLNLRGREPEGVVPAAEYATARERVAAALDAWRDEAGRPVVARVWPREELYAGPAVERAPDLILELASVGGYSPSCLRSQGAGPALRQLARAEHGGGKGRGMNGAHRREGILMLAGEGVRPAALPPVDIVDVLPTLLALADLPVPAGLDGRPIGGALTHVPALAPADEPTATREPVPFDDEATRDLAARLAALGYLEPER
jgi:predicted AlkP superfamily phosphohydrolase/phosphomutase